MNDREVSSAIETSPWERELAACKAWAESETAEEREIISQILETIRIPTNFF